MLGPTPSTTEPDPMDFDSRVRNSLQGEEEVFQAVNYWRIKSKFSLVFSLFPRKGKKIYGARKSEREPIRDKSEP